MFSTFSLFKLDIQFLLILGDLVMDVRCGVAVEILGDLVMDVRCVIVKIFGDLAMDVRCGVAVDYWGPCYGC
jgi:hypothetical protein